jgi:2,5-diketo-D-gluconate reductase A
MSTSATRAPGIPLRGGVEIPQLGFGVFQVPPGQTVDAVSLALATGYRHIDTAAAYGNEAQVGEAIRASGRQRGEVFVTTKCPNDQHGYEEAKGAMQGSLQRLQVDYVDLYLIHWPVPVHDRYVETWRAFIDMRDEGLARAIGVSNFLPAHLERVISETGETPAINQIELHPYFQQREARREHERLGIVTESYSPLAQGRVLSDPVLVAIAERHSRTTAQIVIRWHLQIGNVVIPKSATPERVRQNFEVFDFELSPQEIEAIDRLDAGRRTGGDPETFVRQ